MAYKIGEPVRLKFLAFDGDAPEVYFVENGFDAEVNLAIMNHLDEIRDLLGRQIGADFVYFPLLLQEAKKKVLYQYPNVQKDAFSMSISSDIVWDMLVNRSQKFPLRTCILQFDAPEENMIEDGYDYYNAYPFSIDSEEDLMPMMQDLASRLMPWNMAFYARYAEPLCGEDAEFYPDADSAFNKKIGEMLDHLFYEVEQLELMGVSEWAIKQYIFPEKKVSRMIITEKYDIILPDYHDMVIKMEPLVKAVYILFLRHEEGILFKCLADYREELYNIYMDIRSKMSLPAHLSEEKIRQSIEALTNPLSNSINEKCARIRATFVARFEDSLAKNYCIDGERGEAKRIILDRKLVEWK